MNITTPESRLRSEAIVIIGILLAVARTSELQQSVCSFNVRITFSFFFVWRMLTNKQTTIAESNPGMGLLTQQIFCCSPDILGLSTHLTEGKKYDFKKKPIYDC